MNQSATNHARPPGAGPQLHPDFADSVCAKLDELAKLQENWDSYGGHALDANILAAARNFIKSLPDSIAIRPRVVPMSAGNLQFEWHHGSRILEFEVETPHIIHYLRWDPPGGIEVEDTFEITDIDKAVELIQWFMSGTST